MIQFIKKLFHRKPKQLRCLTCKHFTWWDGDYCCWDKMQILCPSEDGYISKEIYQKLSSKYSYCLKHRKLRCKHRVFNESDIVK